MNNELMNVQSKLKAPKGQLNKFGGYKYRNCEDILEAVKPLLHANGATIVINDDIVEVGGRIYVKATVKFESESGVVESVAFAREAQSKKGMDESQITGSASSYARKYALNALLLIDDTKDADTTNTHSNNDSQGEEYYSQGNFDKNFPVWSQAIIEGKKTNAEIINLVKTKGKLTDKQVAMIEAVQA